MKIGLHAVGKQQNTWFQVHDVPGCELSPPEFVMKSHRCFQPVEQIWDEITALPGNSTIVTANLWCSVTFSRFEKVIPRMRDMV